MRTVTPGSGVRFLVTKARRAKSNHEPFVVTFFFKLKFLDLVGMLGRKGCHMHRFSFRMVVSLFYYRAYSVHRW